MTVEVPTQAGSVDGMSMSWLIALSLLAAILVSQNSQAAVITWRVTGAVVEWSNSGETLPFSGSVGDVYAADFTFDTESIDSADDSDVAYYHGAISTVTFRLNGSDATMAYPEGFRTIYVLNDHEIQGESGYWDEVTFATRSSSSDPAILAGMSFLSNNAERPASPLSSDSMPIQSDLLMLFSERYSYFVSTNPNDYMIGNISSIAVVPLPAAAPLLVMGIVALGALRIRPRLY